MTNPDSCSEDSMWPKSVSSTGTICSGSINSRDCKGVVNVRSIDQATSGPRPTKSARKHEASKVANKPSSLARSANVSRRDRPVRKEHEPTSVDELESTLEILRAQSKERACVDAVKINFSQKQFLCDVYEQRYFAPVDVSTRAITEILFRAACDHQLPIEFREVLPYLFLYPCDKAKIESTDEETRVQLYVCVGDLLRCKYLLLTRLHNDVHVAIKEYREYERKLNFSQEKVPAFFIRGRSHPVATPPANRTHHTLVSELSDNFSIYTAGDIRMRTEFRISDRGILRVYLILHALANWFDCPGMVQKSTREFMGTLMAALSRYPDCSARICDPTTQAQNVERATEG
ncbi:hypothetical protein CYMTET_2725 [Cymbomonas tetramitiformis]|uniref:Uncharacterized protein n=1 Tax=Cymbomonas tetramitiformis TaxID=36881 RepID=A0AAE0C0Z7_9CHLO|nr:hypothetical protein CYMTET_44600 [Cymbomonas tetramitiformis]KAK3289866.1 hypothetical protein CYMTET_2725 [Cymbomonas tetramitiformis]